MTHHHARLVAVAIAAVSFSTPITAQQEPASPTTLKSVVETLGGSLIGTASSDEGPWALANLGFTEATDADLAHFMGLTALESLSLASTRITDAGLAHPGYLLRRANVALRENVTLGPWIHVESKVWNIRALSVDEPFTTRAVVLDNYEKNGHLFVDLDVVIAARDRDPVCRVRHKAIYVPRQLRETTET